MVLLFAFIIALSVNYFVFMIISSIVLRRIINVLIVANIYVPRFKRH